MRRRQVIRRGAPVVGEISGRACGLSLDPLKETIENDVDREEEYQRRFWARRLDGIVVDKEKELCHVLEFK